MLERANSLTSITNVEMKIKIRTMHETNENKKYIVLYNTYWLLYCQGHIHITKNRKNTVNKMTTMYWIKLEIKCDEIVFSLYH